jgi:hypothetical protein
LEYSGTVHQLFIDLYKAYVSLRREIFYSIFTEFGVPMKLVRVIKTCLNETCTNVCIGKNLIMFPIENGLNKEMLYHHCLSTLLKNMPSGMSKKIRKVWS